MRIMPIVNRQSHKCGKDAKRKIRNCPGQKAVVIACKQWALQQLITQILLSSTRVAWNLLRPLWS